MVSLLAHICVTRPQWVNASCQTRHLKRGCQNFRMQKRLTLVNWIANNSGEMLIRRRAGSWTEFSKTWKLQPRVRTQSAKIVIPNYDLVNNLWLNLSYSIGICEWQALADDHISMDKVGAKLLMRTSSAIFLMKYVNTIPMLILMPPWRANIYNLCTYIKSWKM